MKIICKALTIALKALNGAVIRYVDFMADMGEKIVDITTFGLLKNRDAKP